MLAWRRRQQLIFFGYSDAEIARLGDLNALTNERMNELIHSTNLEIADCKSKAAGDVPVLDHGTRHVIPQP